MSSGGSGHKVGESGILGNFISCYVYASSVGHFRGKETGGIYWTESELSP